MTKLLDESGKINKLFSRGDFEKKFHCNVMGFMNDGIQLITNLAVVECHTEMSPGEKRRKWSMSGCQSISCESCLPACKAQALNWFHEC